jgi:hypothetical protein
LDYDSGQREIKTEEVYPFGLRRLVFLTVIVNVALLAAMGVHRVRRIDPRGRYKTIAGSTVPGTTVVAQRVLEYGIPILLLAAVGVWLWRDDDGFIAALYAVAVFIAIPFGWAQYAGRAIAGYSTSRSLQVMVTIWLACCGVIAARYAWRLRGPRSRWTVTVTTTTTTTTRGPLR